MRPHPATYPRTQDRTPEPAHHPPRKTLKQHARTPQAPHTHPSACVHRKPQCPHAPIRPKVPPTAGHRVPPLCTPTATTYGPALQSEPLGLPRGRTRPHPLPPLRGPQPQAPRADRNPSRTPPASHPSFFGPFTGTLRPRTPHTQHNTPSGHTGEQEPSCPGHRTRKTTHRAGTPVNRSKVAQDTAQARQHTKHANRGVA